MSIFEELIIVAFKKSVEVLKDYKMNVTESEKNKIIEVLNSCFENKVKAFKFCSESPKINIHGPLILNDQLYAKSIEIKKLLISDNRPNDPHAVLSKTPYWNSESLVFDCEYIDYSGIQALRTENIKPEILSANAVIICPENEEIVLHDRSPQSDTYPNSIHIIGGAYMPSTANNVAPDRAGFKSTIAREILEETQTSVSTKIKAPFLITKELTTGFIQVNFLGINLTIDQSEELEHNWEGNIVKIKFREILEFLIDRDNFIVPSGKAVILAWLALGAPGVKSSQKFSKMSSKEVFKNVTDSIQRDENLYVKAT